jgi:hypothetical protein
VFLGVKIKKNKKKKKKKSDVVMPRQGVKILVYV